MSTGTDPRIIAALGLVTGTVCLIQGLKLLNEKRIIENTPTSNIRSLAIGPVEIHGKVIPINTVKSPLMNKDCVYYSYAVQEYRTHTVTDSKGNTRTESSWVVISAGEERKDFYIKDDTGKVFINPIKANMQMAPDFNIETTTTSILPQSVISFMSSNKISLNGARRRYTESYVLPNDDLYLFGTATIAPEERLYSTKHEENIVIQKGKELFMISDQSEKNVIKSYNIGIALYTLFGLAMTVICILILTGTLIIN